MVESTAVPEVAGVPTLPLSLAAVGVAGPSCSLVPLTSTGLSALRTDDNLALPPMLARVRGAAVVFVAGLVSTFSWPCALLEELAVGRVMRAKKLSSAWMAFGAGFLVGTLVFSDPLFTVSEDVLAPPSEALAVDEALTLREEIVLSTGLVFSCFAANEAVGAVRRDDTLIARPGDLGPLRIGRLQ